MSELGGRRVKVYQSPTGRTHPMATVVFVEKDGQRIDISDAERIIETRCDGCGEYTPAYDVAQVNLTVNRGGITLASSFLEGHLDHILEKLAERIAAMAVAHKP